MADSMTQSRAIHPVQAVLVSSSLPLFLGALLSDWAYSKSYEIQWTNFASWLIAGALVFVGLALLWAIIDALRPDVEAKRARWIHVAMLIATFAAGLLNALIHARDAWAAMPAGLILSVIALVFAIAAIWTGFAPHRGRDAR